MATAALQPLSLRTSPFLEADGKTITLPFYLYLKSLQQVVQALQGGIGASIVTAKLTTAEGSMTFVNGILTAETPAT